MPRNPVSWRSVGLFCLLAIFNGDLLIQKAQAEPTVTVEVVLKKVRMLGDDSENLSKADFYWRTIIAGRDVNNEDSRSQDALEGRNEIAPDWFMRNTVDRGTTGTVRVSIFVYDEDGWFNGGDDLIDISPSPTSKGITFDIDIDTCTVTPTSGSGPFSAPAGLTCGQVISVNGDGEPDADGKAYAEFAVNLTFAGGQNDFSVRCLHSPLIIPNANSPFQINATALDATGNSIPANSIQIWVAYPASVTSSLGIPTGQPANWICSGGTNCTLSIMPGSALAPPSVANSVSYRCSASIPGATGPRETTWRTTPLGLPPGDGAIPVVRTGPESSRIDYVFIADQTYEGGSENLTFRQDILNLITNSFYSEPVFLENQDHMNFFLSRSQGRAADFDVSSCDHTVPSDWDDNYSFAEAGAIIHDWETLPGAEFFRDCAPYGENYFSAPKTAVRTVLHEIGHRPFGLADEYCCDGGYHYSDQPNIYPILHPGQGQGMFCERDAANLGRAASACRVITAAPPYTGGIPWKTSEPVRYDLMGYVYPGGSPGLPQAADLRAIRWLFGECAATRC